MIPLLLEGILAWLGKKFRQDAGFYFYWVFLLYDPYVLLAHGIMSFQPINRGAVWLFLVLYCRKKSVGPTLSDLICHAW